MGACLFTLPTLGPLHGLRATFSQKKVTEMSTEEPAVMELGVQQVQMGGKSKASPEEWMVSPLVTCKKVVSSLYPSWMIPLGSSSASALVTTAWWGCTSPASGLDIHLSSGKWACCKTGHYTKDGGGKIRASTQQWGTRGELPDPAVCRSVTELSGADCKQVMWGHNILSLDPCSIVTARLDLHLNGWIGGSPTLFLFVCVHAHVCVTCIPHIGSSHR